MDLGDVPAAHPWIRPAARLLQAEQNGLARRDDQMPDLAGIRPGRTADRFPRWLRNNRGRDHCTASAMWPNPQASQAVGSPPGTGWEACHEQNGQRGRIKLASTAWSTG